MITETDLLDGSPIGTESVTDAGRDEAEPPEELREAVEALRLWVTGMTDRAIARELALSLGTLRRRVVTLRQRLGARSRIEAVVIATARGWLRPRAEDDSKQ